MQLTLHSTSITQTPSFQEVKPMTNRNSINVSFPEEETKLYKDILLESSYTDIPVAALSRKYMKLGMQCTKRKSLTSGGV